LGLMLNELLTNAFKYGLDSAQPTISITLDKINEEDYRLLFKDNGKGIEREVDFKRNSSFGMRLLGILSRQLMGKVQYRTDGGAEFEIEFKTLL